MDHYLSLEALLIDRWKAAMPELKAVHALSELPDIQDQKQTAPAGFVYWDGDQVVSVQEDGSTTIDQRWAFVIAVKNVGDIKSGRRARDEAGPLIDKTIITFAGWKPAEGVKPLRRATGPGPAYRGGHFYYPVVFTARFFTRGAA